MSKRRVRRPIHNPSSNTLTYVAIGGALVVSAYLLVVRPTLQGAMALGNTGF